MPNFTRKIKQLLTGGDVAHSEPLEVHTPQFGRGDDIDPADASDFDRWDELHEFDEGVKRSIGMRTWETTDEGTLWLFPYEWREDIPEGMTVTTILWNEEAYDPDEYTDKRFGVLACGVVSSGD